MNTKQTVVQHAVEPGIQSPTVVLNVFKEIDSKCTWFSKPSVCEVEDKPLPVLCSSCLHVGAVLSLAKLGVAPVQAQEACVLLVQR